MSRQRIPDERRKMLRRQAIAAGVPWTIADDYELDDAGPVRLVTGETLAKAADDAGDLWGSMLNEDGRPKR